MKSTGIVRPVDQLGRLVLPMELRRTMDIKEDDRMGIFVDGDTIVLRKYEPACIFCGQAKETGDFKGKLICTDCMVQLRK